MGAVSLTADVTGTLPVGNGGTGNTSGTASAVAVGGITGLGTGVETALTVNVGTAGAPVVNGGALGTPSSGTLTGCTGFPAAQGSSLVLISTATASTSAAIDFTSGITSTYDEYLITITAAVPATNDANLALRFSEDGGSTFKAGATDYSYAYNINTESAASVAGGSTGASLILVAIDASSTASKGGFNGEIRIFNPSSTSTNKVCTFHIAGASDANFRTINGAGRFILDTNAINGFRLLMDTGNITSGTFALYGVKK